MWLVADARACSLWPILHYDDTEAARRFLVDGLGLREALVQRDEIGDIVHCELRWPGGGAVLFGGTKHTGGVHQGHKAAALYLFTADVDAVYQRVTRFGGEIVAPPHATEFGTGIAAYSFTTKDTEGNLWTVGNYRGAA